VAYGARTLGDLADLTAAARRLQGPEVVVGADPLAVEVESLRVDGLDAEEHVAQAEAGPAAEDLGVAEQDVAARLEVVALADAAALDFRGGGVDGALGLVCSTMPTGPLAPDPAATRMPKVITTCRTPSCRRAAGREPAVRDLNPEPAD
jgi:hypothetical protein